MSREAILKIREVEETAKRMVADAKTEAQKMIETAQAEGKALCERTENDVGAEYGTKLTELGERAAEMRERVESEGQEELSSMETEIRLRRRGAEKIIIRGFEQKCR